MRAPIIQGCQTIVMAQVDYDVCDEQESDRKQDKALFAIIGTVTGSRRTLPPAAFLERAAQEPVKC